MRNILSSNKKLLAIIYILVGISLGWVLFSGNSESEDSAPQQETPSTIWTCAMHPQIRLQEAVPCPLCGMDLTEMDASSEEEQDLYTLKMSPSAVLISNIQLSKVVNRIPEKEILLEGKIKPDERRQFQVSAEYSGRIDKLWVSYTGARIRKGQKIVTLHSPEFITAQAEFFDATSLRAMQPSVYIAARNKLRRWNVSEARIEEIENGGGIQKVVELTAPVYGTVLKQFVSEGQYIQEGSPLFDLADLSKVWVLFEVYEADMPWLHIGDTIRFTIPSIAGKQFTSKITFIEPVLDPNTRTVSVRVEVPNPKRLLKPDMFVNGWLYASSNGKEQALLVPKSAVLWTGKRSIVYVNVGKHGAPSFQLKEVVLGEEVGAYYIVKKGLQAGEEVVSNGVFKVDAAAQLAGNFSMMNPPVSHSQPLSVQTDDRFAVQLDTLLQTYLQLKNALVQSNPKHTAHTAEMALAHMHSIHAKNLSREASAAWKKYEEQLEKMFHQLHHHTDLEAQRKTFQQLTHTITQLVQQFEPNSSTIYQSYCPMAFENQGAFWLSESEEIMNPYFGDKMLNCGWIESELPAKE